jgi:signal transduction histidine kinase
MKLFTQYSRVNILASILALLLGSIAYYIVVRLVLIHQLDETIRIEEAEILDFVKNRDRLPEPANYRDQIISFTPADTPIKRHFTDPEWYSRRHHDHRPFRQLQFPITVGGQTYTASVAKSEVETEDLLGFIMIITGGIIVLLLITLFLANRLLLRRIWQPFYNTLESIRQFNLSSRKPLPASNTNIEEFNNLDIAVEQMTHKILKDYEMLKNFADNASHEMQTPLAIINSKLDLMIQDTGLAEKHLRQLQAMYDAVGRLSKLNQSLLLLTKIENNQFTHTDLVELAPLIEEKLLQFEDLVKAKRLRVHTSLDMVSIRMNQYLADILLNNLLINAIRHNQEEGAINIRLTKEDLQISNTGPVLLFDPVTIFDRFIKGSHSDGTGLGLAIVKQIADNHGFSLSYSFNNNLHLIHIRFPLQNFDKIGN